MSVTVSTIIDRMAVLAPPSLAAEWDNPGLQVGAGSWPVGTVMVALDPTLDAVRAAREAGAGMLITHHPLLFRPLSAVDPEAPNGAILEMALNHKLAIFSAHTNFDAVPGGVNDLLAERLGITPLRPIQLTDRPFCRIAVYAPEESTSAILDALFEAGAGVIGDYTCCSFRCQGRGTFRPGPTARPQVGEAGKTADVAEVKIEARLPESLLPTLLARLRECHPYETMAYDIFPLRSEDGGAGIGRFGILDRPIPLSELGRRARKALGTPTVRVAGDPSLSVERVAVCAGSGSSLMGDFLASDAQAFITGDLRYHDARDAEAAGRGLVDVGHFPSEHLAMTVLAERLRAALSTDGDAVDVYLYDGETDPFRLA